MRPQLCSRQRPSGPDLLPFQCMDEMRFKRLYRCENTLMFRLLDRTWLQSSPPKKKAREAKTEMAPPLAISPFNQS